MSQRHSHHPAQGLDDAFGQLFCSHNYASRKWVLPYTLNEDVDIIPCDGNTKLMLLNLWHLSTLN